MKLSFNPMRLLIVSLSTLIIVASASWYAKSIKSKMRKPSKSEPSPIISERRPSGEPDNTSATGVPEITPPQMPTPSLAPSGTAEFSPELRDSLKSVPNTPLGPLKPVQDVVFSIESDGADAALNKKKIPLSIREALIAHGVPLSKRAAVKVIKKGSEWEIADGERTYRLRGNQGSLNIQVDGVKHTTWFQKPDDWQTFDLEDSIYVLRSFLEDPAQYYGRFDLQEDLNVWLSKSLFSLESKSEGALNSGRVSNAIRQQFARQGLPLAQDAKVLLEKKDHRWAVKDANQTYGVHKEADQLNVYVRQPDWTPMPWNELRLRYMQQYPERGQPLRQDGDRFDLPVTEAHRQIWARTRYRLVDIE